MLKETIVNLLKDVVSPTKEEIEKLLEVPPNPDLGDIAFPCFILAKQFKKNPTVIAAEIAEQLNNNQKSENINVQSQGAYINFFFKNEVWSEKLLNSILKKDFTKMEIGNNERIIIDMSSPNIAKPFGIGHLRSTMIGNALYHIYKTAGYDPVRVNHLGDWGTQFGKQITAYKRWGDPQKMEENAIHECLQLYVKFHEEAENDPELEKEARLWFKKLEDGDEEATELWKFFIELSLKEFKFMYDKLGVEFDYYLGESFYNDKMSPVVLELKEKGLLEESEGAMVVRLDEAEMPPCLILKSDGTTIYPTRDLATAIYRHEEMQGSKILYVVGAEQQLHFKQVFAVLDKMGKAWSSDCEHIPFGLMKYEGKKMSTRRGKVIFLEKVLEEAVTKATEIINEKSPELSNKNEVAEAIGIGSVIFNDLKNNRIQEVDFSLEDALNFEGETGPYVQYTYARTQSLLEKGAWDEAWINELTLTDGKHLNDQASWGLTKELMNFPNVIQHALKKNEPSVLARYVLEIAKKFNRYYNQVRINVEDENEKKTKLILTYATGKILKESIHCLGLKSPSKI
ncbi:arginine--tRNA ligase [Chengkuizengella axinellae]|uniref:Arginine--tRNA ligase n=1 Tax=Chengkuizengella axinellae TaxID=3064388 RepID=A0ABT9J2B1_9BACL|nr:arginine--tRNA ligase [Chengkuizengella sp. 2205SS18-9]MDP5275754.1 arginine--tRNA ligase [Chengkuizengella sp. 2205SS18-9]